MEEKWFVKGRREHWIFHSNSCIEESPVRKGR